MNEIIEYYAHSHPEVEKSDWHLLSHHLKNTGDRSASSLKDVGCEELARVLGLLHDLGKYSSEFQGRLAGNHARVNHSTAGAKIALERYGENLGKLLAFCIAGHHSGLANGVNGQRITALKDRLQEHVPILDPVWKREIEIPPSLKPPHFKLPEQDGYAGHSVSMLVRMLFSALVDADYLDTEAWFAEKEGRQINRGSFASLEKLRVRLSDFLEKLSGNSNASFVNDLRLQILTHARSKATDSPGLFSLTVPTGGGKTLTSLAFALDHAIENGLDRVIYVIPYTSIVEQTAAVFRKALSRDENENDPIIEHHSNFDEGQNTFRESREKLRLAMENWDAPIIITTSVQFFESLFANRPSRCRKLHNIANSVVILDEAQSLPLKFLRPCIATIDELARNWRTSIVLCTATQPALGESDGFVGGLQNIRELAPEPSRLQKSLMRTTIVREERQIDDQELASYFESLPQVLCIVNTRRHARELYESIRHLEGALHLSTLMCARHRSKRLESVQRRLKGGEPVRLISTSLVEAGVDLDFPTVWRAESGLESIIQAAGRCNREGRLELGKVHVFEPVPGEGRGTPPSIEKFAGVARSIFRNHEDPVKLSAIREYFKELYWIQGGESLDKMQILKRLEREKAGFDFPFEEIANDFHLIESPLVPVIVPWTGGCDQQDDSVKSLIDSLQWVEKPGMIARKLQPFVVQIPQQSRSELLNTGAASAICPAKFGDQFIELKNEDIYFDDIGLSWDDPLFRSSESLIF